jgi:hypothetical protein
MAELDFSFSFHELDTWKIPKKFIVLQIHLNGSNTRFPQTFGDSKPRIWQFGGKTVLAGLRLIKK